jgi:S-methylmethionine-dependent homocysteine/selenocysteine methylase
VLISVILLQCWYCAVQEAQEYHSWQIGVLKEAGVDVVIAYTLPYVEVHSMLQQSAVFASCCVCSTIVACSSNLLHTVFIYKHTITIYNTSALAIRHQCHYEHAPSGTLANYTLAVYAL